MTTRDKVLEALCESKGLYLSGEMLSNKLDMSRAAVWKAIKTLREEGYSIEAVTNKGYRLVSGDLELTEETLKNALLGKYRDNKLFVYDVTDSTNLRARQYVADMAASGDDYHGAVFISSQQTAGRGRLGRSFFSPKDGIYMSIVIRPDFDMSHSLLVTVAAATAVSQAIDEICSKASKIKWVNDIYIDNKKVCGILTEATTDFETGRIESIIIGIGINTSVEGFPEELRKIAGAVEGEYSKPDLVAMIIHKVMTNIDEIASGSCSFVDSYRDKSLLIGNTIKVYKGAYRSDPTQEIGGITAKALGIDHRGGLEVIYTDGTRETLTAGEVSIRLDQNE